MKGLEGVEVAGDLGAGDEDGDAVEIGDGNLNVGAGGGTNGADA